MTKEEFNKRVTELKNEREKINKLIYDAAMEYISSLPYKEGDKICTDYRSAVRITSITPHKDDKHNRGQVFRQSDRRTILPTVRDKLRGYNKCAHICK